MPTADRPDLLARGLTWPEAPRWHRGALWVSDVHNFRLVRIDPTGAVATVLPVPGRPSGMDVVAPGRIVLATALDRTLLRVDAAQGTSEQAADLRGLARAQLNDLVASPSGWVWVGDTGFAFGTEEPRPCGRVIAYHPEAGARVVAEDVFFPNGMALAPGGATLYLAETFARRVTAFAVGAAGALEGRRVHAELAGSPDGLCLDAEGCLWVALLFEGEFVRVAPDGRTVARIAFAGRNAIACVLGGDDRSTLFLCVSEVDRSDPGRVVRDGESYTGRAPAPGAGRP